MLGVLETTFATTIENSSNLGLWDEFCAQLRGLLQNGFAPRPRNQTQKHMGLSVSWQ